MKKEESVSTVRSFIRRFVKETGLLSERPYDSKLGLLESRIIFELAQRPHLRAKDLVDELSVDKGYLSRAISTLVRKKLVHLEPNSQDRREKKLALTPQGKIQFKKIDRVSKERTQALLDRMDPPRARSFAAQVAAADLCLQPKIDRQEVRLRTLREGDIGWMIQRHGEIYFEEYGWNRDFEQLVAEIALSYAKKHNPQRESAWIAEARGLRLGCVLLVKESESIAKLRILLVEPGARGLGIGSLLVKRCIGFARQAGYKKITLWTNSILVSARRIYEAEGFSLEKEEEHRSFGQKLTGQYWSKALD